MDDEINQDHPEQGKNIKGQISRDGLTRSEGMGEVPVEKIEEEKPSLDENIVENKEFGVVDTLVELILRPGSALGRLKTSGTAAFSIAVFMIAQASYLLSKMVIFNEALSLVQLVSIYALQVLICAFLWVLIASVYHLISDAAKSDGRAGGLFVLLGFCFLPAFFLPPASVILMFIGWHPGLLYFMIFVFTNIWITVLVVKSIHANYKIDYFRSFLVAVSPFAGMVIFAAFVMIFLLTMAVTLFTKTMSFI